MELKCHRAKEKFFTRLVRGAAGGGAEARLGVAWGVWKGGKCWCYCVVAGFPQERGRFGHAAAMSEGKQPAVKSTSRKIRGPTLYILFAVPAVSLAAIFAISLRNQFSQFTNL